MNFCEEDNQLSRNFSFRNETQVRDWQSMVKILDILQNIHTLEYGPLINLDTSRVLPFILYGSPPSTTFYSLIQKSLECEDCTKG